MTKTLQRRRLRAVAALAVVGALAAAPAAADAASTSGDLDRPREVTRDRLAGSQGVTPGGSFSAAGVADTCPDGTVRGATVLYDSFEDGHPDDGFNTWGWALDSIGGAAAGSTYTWSASPGNAPDDVNYMFLEESFVRPGATTFLSFAARGVAGDENLLVGVNDEAWTLSELDPELWAPITIDVTAATDDYEDGYLDVVFAHLGDLDPDTRFEVDDVTIYHCGPAASGVRGDWTGGGTADLLAVAGNGDLNLYPGRGDGTIGNGTRMGTRWGAMTWIGSPGDVDGDDRTDLLARHSNGNLYRYSGRPNSALANGVLVGTGWNGLTALVTGGDTNGDGRPDVLGRTANGNLYRYTISSTGALSNGRLVGTGWNGITTFVIVEDTDGDARDDVLGITKSGDLYRYRGTDTGLVNGRKVGSGWSSLQLVTSPGDLDGDLRSDVVGRSSNGDLVRYLGTSTGLSSGQKIGSRWGGFVRLL